MQQDRQAFFCILRTLVVAAALGIKLVNVEIKF